MNEPVYYEPDDAFIEYEGRPKEVVFLEFDKIDIRLPVNVIVDQTPRYKVKVEYDAIIIPRSNTKPNNKFIKDAEFF
jgi:hypothetical protein